jgi:hypothetical protein
LNSTQLFWNCAVSRDSARYCIIHSNLDTVIDLANIEVGPEADWDDHAQQDEEPNELHVPHPLKSVQTHHGQRGQDYNDEQVLGQSIYFKVQLPDFILRVLAVHPESSFLACIDDEAQDIAIRSYDCVRPDGVHKGQTFFGAAIISFVIPFEVVDLFVWRAGYHLQLALPQVRMVFNLLREGNRHSEFPVGLAIQLVCFDEGAST